jgi:hypothetical protein
MKLPDSQVERFYAIWRPLILFANERLGVVPGLPAGDGVESWDVSEVVKIRDALWADDSLREAFLAENPAKLSPEDLAIVESWRHRRAGAFFVLRHLQKYSIFIAEKPSAVYGVLGLVSPLAEVLPFVPCCTKAILLPFETHIIYDSLLVPYNIYFGKGIRSSLERTYKDAKERGAILTSLLPASAPPSRSAAVEAVRASNAKVLAAFRARLFAANLSAKVVERDVANVTAFAEGYLLDRPEPRSLRDFHSDDLLRYLSQVHAAAGKGRPKAVPLSFKRFIRFLRDTERLDYDVAEYLLEMLKGHG